MSRLRPLALAAFSVLALCAYTASAVAKPAKTPTQAPVADCKAHNGTLTKTYSNAELRKALASISPSVNEYTTCYQTIENQLSNQLGTQNINGAGSGSSGGGSGTLIIVIVVVVVLLLGGGGAFWAHRRNRAGGPGSDDLA